MDAGFLLPALLDLTGHSSEAALFGVFGDFGVFGVFGVDTSFAGFFPFNALIAPATEATLPNFEPPALLAGFLSDFDAVLFAPPLITYPGLPIVTLIDLFNFLILSSSSTKTGPS